MSDKDTFKQWVFDNIFTIMTAVLVIGGMLLKMQSIDERLSNIEKALGVGEIKIVVDNK